MMHNNLNLDLVNINAHICIKFGKSLSICSLDTEQKQKYDVNQGPTLC